MLSKLKGYSQLYSNEWKDMVWKKFLTIMGFLGKKLFSSWNLWAFIWINVGLGGYSYVIKGEVSSGNILSHSERVSKFCGE